MSQEELRRVEVLARVPQQPTADDRREPAAGCELPAGQAAVEALSRRGCCEFETPQCRVHLESCLCAEVSAAGAGSGTEEVRRAGGRAFRADAGGRALGRRRWVSSVALPKKVTHEFAFSGCDTSSGKVARCGYRGGCRS